MAVDAVIVGATFPDAEIGDRFEITGTAQVTGVFLDLVDVTKLGSRDPEYLPGGRGVRLLIAASSVEPVPPRPF